MMKHYADVKAKPDFVEVEKEVLKFWEENKTFEKSVQNRDGAAEFVFCNDMPLGCRRCGNGYCSESGGGGNTGIAGIDAAAGSLPGEIEQFAY